MLINVKISIFSSLFFMWKIKFQPVILSVRILKTSSNTRLDPQTDQIWLELLKPFKRGRKSNQTFYFLD